MNPARGVPLAMQEETVMRAWILYSVHRYSLHDCARLLHKETGYKTVGSLRKAIHRQFQHRRLPLRPSGSKARPHLANDLALAMYAEHEQGVCIRALARKYAEQLPADHPHTNSYHVRRAFSSRGLAVLHDGRGHWPRAAA